MEFLLPEIEIRKSLERCRYIKLSKEILRPTQYLPKKQLLSRLEGNQLLIQIFQNCTADIIDLIKGNYMFKLYDVDGYLLTWKASDQLPKNLLEVSLFVGMSIREESFGTNAVSLAMDLKRPVYIEPEQHYTHLMNSWCGCAIPLKKAELVVGYLCISSYTQLLTVEAIAILQLLAQLIIENMCNRHVEYAKMHLTYQQQMVLSLSCQGLTEKAIAMEMRLSTNTIKYHKRNIFRILDVNCMTEAVATAIKLGLL